MSRAYIAPYAAPEYWGGHTLGRAEGLPDIPDGEAGAFYGSIAAGALEDYLRTGTEPFALETFRPGDTFTAQAAGIGGIVMARTEMLIGHPDSLAGIERPPVKQPTVAPKLPTSTAHVIERLLESDITYAATTEIGVVIPRFRGPMIYKAAMHEIGWAEDKTDIIVDRRAINTWQLPFAIGHVAHRAWSDGIESMWRATSLQVVKRGRQLLPGRRSDIPAGRTV